MHRQRLQQVILKLLHVLRPVHRELARVLQLQELGMLLLEFSISEANVDFSQS